MANQTESELRLDRLVKRFGEIEAVRGVSLEIRRSEFFTLLGPSGSGKSTLLHMIGGLELPSEGRIYFREIDVTEVPASRRSSSTVFQDLALFPHMTVGQNVEYGLRIRGLSAPERRRRADSMLELVGLTGFYRRNVNRLSGGERQRVALARSLVVEPTVLLLDEPLSGLDEMLRQQMQFELKRIHGELGTTFVAVTHNQEEALSMSDRVGVLRDGRLVQVGTPEELFERPCNEFVADFVGAANLVRGSLEGADGATLRVGPLAFSATPNGAPGAAGAAAVAAIRPERIELGSAAARQDNRCRLALETLLYKGALVEYHLRLPDGQALRARTFSNPFEIMPTPGDDIEVGWAARNMRLLPADAAAERPAP